MSRRLLIALAGAFMALAPVTAETDLDAFMSRVLERRDDNWKKLQQYVLEEREALQITGPGARPIYGSQRDYAWFPRNGIFIKSPLRSDGVEVSERDRRKYEDWYEKLQERREKRQAAKAKGAADHDDTASSSDPNASTRAITEANVREALEPGFVSAAYFMRFKFDPGRYALVGRETFEGRPVLRIEHYPTNLFTEGRTKPNKEIRKRDAEIEAKMNKVALVTLWIDPAEHQILKYEFHNLPLDFLPARQIVHIDGFKAAMEMGQPFPNVWLPRSIRMSFDMTLAIGELDGRYTADYHDYKLATVNTRVR